MFRDIFRRTFAKYLLSYTLCLVLPVSVFSLLYKTIFLSAYSRQLIEKASAGLDDAFLNIDLQMNNLRRIGSQIFSSRQFSARSLDGQPRILNFYTLRETLAVYAMPGEPIFDIWVYDRNNRCLYSSSYLLSLDSLARHGPDYSGGGENFFAGLLETAEGEFWIPQSRVRFFYSSHSLLTYITAYPNSYTHSGLALILFLRQDFFDRTLRALIPYGQSTSAVIDEGGRIIYSLNPELRPLAEKLLERGTPETGGPVTLEDRKEYFVKFWASPQSRLSYLSLIPYGELTGEVRRHTFIFFVILLGIMLGGALLVFLLMRYNYRPLQRIIRLSRERGGGGGGGAGSRRNTDELDLVRAALENISEENISLSLKNEKYLREETLFSLLKGNQVSADRLEEAGIDTGGVEYTAVIFQLEKNKTIPPGEFEAVLGKVIAPFPAAVHLLEYLEQNSFICIVISREEPFYLSRILESLCYEAGKEAGMEIRAAAGSPVSGLQEIALSYSQAKTVLRHQIQKGARKALGFQDLELEAIPDYPYLRSELNTLEDAVAQKSSTRTAFIISELVDTIKHENTSYFYAVCLCYDIINIFIREIYRMKNSAAGEIIRKHQMLFLENFDHPVENLIAIVVSLSREAMRILDREQAPSRAASRGNILKFIEGHYRESNFCVQTILDHFGLSFSNLSHLFKSYMGENISSYIGGLKLNYAKELLSTSGMTVGAIAAKLGYFQTSSFIRKFRIAEGMTPGEYRDKRRTEEPGEKETGD